MEVVLPGDLKKIEALKDVPDGQLQWLIDNSRQYELEEGEYLFRMGDPIAGIHFITKGHIRLFINQPKGERNIPVAAATEITGYLPFSRIVKSAANGQVIERATIITFPKEKVIELIHNNFELTQALVHVMTSRIREFTSLQQQNEKMMALGKLSAGLAHELNNPAAAIVRGSTTLVKHLKMQPDDFKKVMRIRMEPEDVDKVTNILFGIMARTDKPVLTLMQRMDLEDQLVTCLKDMYVDNSDEISENLIENGFTCEDIEQVKKLVPPADLSPVLNWINNNLVTEKMVNDIREASQRIEKLINSVKNFTHMDQDHNKEFTNIHSGITSTLNMLSFKFKKGNVQLVENYDTSLPPVKAFVGELNQVWTNIIDNALDAMGVNNKGILEIQTKRERDNVVVSITDNGPGIPDAIKDKIYDPFFTTKEIGKGTGLGLEVVSRIVLQHKGNIKLETAPGRTSFIICFPLNG